MNIQSSQQYSDIINKLLKDGRITKQEMSEYRKRKQEEDKEKVYEYLKMGISQRKIAEILESTLSIVQTYIEKIKREKGISNEDILHWKEQQPTSMLNRKRVVL